MSMRAPFCSACSVTDFVSVTSSGTISTRSILRRLVQPGKRLPGVGDADEHDRRAGIGKGFRHAWPTAVRPSVTSTRRNFGSQVISRRCGSSAMFGVSFSGSAMATAEPLLSSLQLKPHARRPRPHRHEDARPRPGRRRASRCRPARACARENRDRSRSGTVVSATSVPPGSTSRNGSRADRHDGQASRGG